MYLNFWDIKNWVCVNLNKNVLFEMFYAHTQIKFPNCVILPGGRRVGESFKMYLPVGTDWHTWDLISFNDNDLIRMSRRSCDELHLILGLELVLDVAAHLSRAGLVYGSFKHNVKTSVWRLSRSPWRSAEARILRMLTILNKRVV